MDMIRAHVTLDDDDSPSFSALTDEVAEPLSDLSFQDMIPVFGDPDKMVFDIIERMASSPVVKHYPSPLSQNGNGSVFNFQC